MLGIGDSGGRFCIGCCGCAGEIACVIGDFYRVSEVLWILTEVWGKLTEEFA